MDFRDELAARIRGQRIRLRYSVAKAAKDAGMARDTWAKIEAGKGVHDHNLQAALDLLGLDDRGMERRATVGGGTQDAAHEEFVESQVGERVPSVVTNEDLLREIVRSRAEFDQVRAAVADVGGRLDVVETSIEANRLGLESLSARVAQLEEQSA